MEKHYKRRKMGRGNYELRSYRKKYTLSNAMRHSEWNKGMGHRLRTIFRVDTREDWNITYLENAAWILEVSKTVRNFCVRILEKPQIQREPGIWGWFYLHIILKSERATEELIRSWDVLREGRNTGTDSPRMRPLVNPCPLGLWTDGGSQVPKHNL